LKFYFWIVSGQNILVPVTRTGIEFGNFSFRLSKPPTPHKVRKFRKITRRNGEIVYK
jgi:hypothetical protein